MYKLNNVSLFYFLVIAGLSCASAYAQSASPSPTPAKPPYYGNPGCPGSSSGGPCGAGAKMSVSSKDSSVSVPCNCASGWKETARMTNNSTGVTTIECQCGSTPPKAPYNPPAAPPPVYPKLCCGTTHTGPDNSSCGAYYGQNGTCPGAVGCYFYSAGPRCP